jgi:hypothetical protein
MDYKAKAKLDKDQKGALESEYRGSLANVVCRVGGMRRRGAVEVGSNSKWRLLGAVASFSG